MSNDSNTIDNVDTKIKNEKTKGSNTSKSKDKKSSKPFNVIFYCETCKRIPLLIFSEKSPKIVKYCENNKNTETINPSNLLNMINLKITKKKEEIFQENPNINDININSKEFICTSHGKEFINYCEDCSKNICYSCSKEHFRHKLIHFSQLLPSNKDIREGNKILVEMKRELDKFKSTTKEIIKICESLISIKNTILNNLKNAIDFKKLNFYTIVNYKNILKTKIKLVEKPYTLINPLAEINHKILKSIQKKFEISINEEKKEENDISDDKNENLNKAYNNFTNIMNEYFELNKDQPNIGNNINLDKVDNNNENIKDNNPNLKNKAKIEKINNNNVNNYLNLYINNGITFPLINNSNFDNIKNFQSKLIDLPLHTNNNNNFNLSFSYFSKYEESTIMNINDINFIINLIQSKFNKKLKKLYLCYRASTDGDSAEIFHKKCDYIKNIIILIKTKQQKKFGGFSTESWETNTEIPIHKKDKDAFIFRLDNYKCYYIIKPEKALYCSKKLGPVFGIGEIFIPDNFFKNVSHCNEKEAYKCEIDYENKETLNGEKEFLVEEIEAYKIDF